MIDCVYRRGLNAGAGLFFAVTGCLGAATLWAEESEPKPPFDLADPAIVDEGRVQFAQTCVYCHGNAGSGGKAGPIAGRTDLTEDYLFTTISNGKRAGSLVMPTWKDSLDEPTIWKLVAYVVSLQAKPEAAAK
ncbi:conserved hypothetical protein [Methylocella silvestris BL2]|uniref:Cytochrome c domain-containing protein n=1 Tax=Methylocella silvestris (strain DSM 15510 / CIP 108128 / LMG 27833 / NCIMB 13906 / BL2) TaxID=395965 RepID=B8EJC4_METSB|nr:cytochrome c [Methylocella silvestris]ACK52616.1 conserved hypothetical protein [Methylocella silvestris BL2]